MRIGEQSERRAAVLQVSQIEKPRNNLDAVVQHDVFGNQPFAYPVEKDNDKRDQKMVLAHGGW
jgi:hypothetical protein